MEDIGSLSHSSWDCKYHIVWIPKYLGEIFHDLARQKESWILEGHISIDHVHVYISILSKYSVAQVVGFMKGKSAICCIAGVLAGDKGIL